MAWDRNDFIAAGLIILLGILSVLITAYLLGVLPSIDTIFNFEDPKIKTLYHTVFIPNSSGFYFIIS